MEGKKTEKWAFLTPQISFVRGERGVFISGNGDLPAGFGGAGSSAEGVCVSACEYLYIYIYKYIYINTMYIITCIKKESVYIGALGGAAIAAGALSGCQLRQTGGFAEIAFFLTVN